MQRKGIDANLHDELYSISVCCIIIDACLIIISFFRLNIYCLLVKIYHKKHQKKGERKIDPDIMIEDLGTKKLGEKIKKTVGLSALYFYQI